MADHIPLRGVRVHNLRGIDVDIPLRQLTVIAGVSGAGKSSLAFDTLYAEAQRRYLQSFSAYTRQFLERLDQPDADFLGDLPPAIAVSHRSIAQGPRTTVGTVTEIFDYLRLFLARYGTVHCLKCHREVRAQKTADVLASLASFPPGTRLSIAFPVPSSFEHAALSKLPALTSAPSKLAALTTLFAQMKEEGFVRLRVGGTTFRLDEPTLPELDPGQKIWVLVDRIETGQTPPARVHDSLETAFNRGAGQLALLEDAIDRGPPREHLFDDRLRCPYCEILYPDPEPGLLHFNDPRGACPGCQGTGLDAKTKETCAVCQGSRLSEQTGYLLWNGRNLADLCRLTLRELDEILREGEAREGEAREGEAREGEAREGEAREGEAPPEPFRRDAFGPVTARQEPRPPAVDRPPAVSAPLLETVRARLAYLLAVELGYLTLQRSADSLSTGEARRIRLTTALGSNLVNALYVFDEPTAGLHPRDTGRLLAELLKLRSAGNTLVVVEHDAEVLAHADHVIDMGPGAGEEGGRVLYQGPVAGLADAEDSLTADYFAGRLTVEVPRRRRPTNHGKLRLSGATCHNLRNLTVEFPLGVLCVVTGVSGAGKSSLVQHTLYPALKKKGRKGEGEKGRKDESVLNRVSTPVSPSPPLPFSPSSVQGADQINEVVLMDQEPLARSGRSNPATYLKVFDDIRKVFAETVDARIHNFPAGHFSFNQPGGRCETCAGQGSLSVDMQFLADVTMTCPECLGSRFKKEILDIKVRSLNIAEVLNLTAREAFRFFRAQPAIERRLKHLLDVGLDYLRLGQPADTLSGGECQRLKLAGHLAASRKSRCLFLLLEPTIGLHPADVARLISCFDHLLEAGHSLIVVEHNLDVIKSADHVIDLGPGAGPLGGAIVGVGTPEEIAGVPESATGQCLRTRN